MENRNASASAFGWDFQTNAAILLMLENIQMADKVRVEGKDEDIEITLSDKTKIYSQAKAVAKPDDYSHVIDKLVAALETLNQASANNDGSLFTYVTNSPNPFNNQKTMSFFTSTTHLFFDELPDAAQTKITEILKNKGFDNLDTSKLDVRVFPFYGRDLKNRYKEIRAAVNELLSELQMPTDGIGKEILQIWQRDFFQNATMPDTAISIDKKKMMWPLIVLVVDKAVASEYKKEFDDDEIGEIERKYKLVINQQTMLYEFVTKVISDYRLSKQTAKEYINTSWNNYLYTIESIEADDKTKEALMKIILYRILTQRQYINDIKKGVNL